MIAVDLGPAIDTLRAAFTDAGLAAELPAVEPYTCCQDFRCRLTEDAVYGPAEMTP